MVSSRRAFVLSGTSLFAASALGLPAAHAQSWPQRNVRVLLPIGAGSGTDIGMRLLADRLHKRWGHPVVIENRPGGDGVVAITAFVSAKDDHVLLGAPVSAFTSHPYVLPNMPYKPDDLAPIARGWTLIIVIAVPASLPVNSLKELVDMIKAQPGKLNWAGTTGTIDFLFHAFLKQHELVMERVPYRNPQEAANDLASGRIQVCEASYATLRPQLERGAIKLIAATNAERPAALPKLQTVKEAGYPELTLDGLIGLFGQPSMPPALRERIAADVKVAMTDKVLIERLNATGQMPDFGTAAEFENSINTQRAMVAAAAKRLGITPSL